MRPNRIAILLLLLFPVVLLAQRENNRWCFGNRAGIDFSSGVAVEASDNAMHSYEGCASIADPVTGELLFYTNGDSVWNNFHQLMPNGMGLGGHWSSTQSALIVPMPGTSHRYYVFVSDAGEYVESPNSGIHYSVVDMTLDNGRGDVVDKGRELVAKATEKLTAIRMRGGEGYWIITTSRFDNAIYAFRVSRCGVSLDPVVSYAGQYPETWRPTFELGYLKASPDGRRLASATMVSNIVQVFDFDPVAGVVSNAISLSVGFPYGLSFSPNGSWLYVGDLEHRVVLRFDARLRTAATMQASQQEVEGSRGVFVHAMQVAPDGRIYCSVQPERFSLGGAKFIGAIDNPDGTTPGFRANALGLRDGICHLGLPNMIVNNADVPLAGPDAVICSGGSATLRATGGKSYRWSPADGLSCTDCSVTTASPERTTRYIVEITNNECVVTDTVTVAVQEMQVDAGRDRSICRGDSVLLNATGANTYQWTPIDGLTCADCAAPAAYPAVTTTYTVVGTSMEGCRDTARVTVYVGDTLFVDAGTTVVICPGDSVRLQGTGGEGFQWSPGDGLSCTSCPDPVASPSVTTLYTLRSFNAGDCEGVDTVRVVVAGPTPEVKAGDDMELCEGESVQLHGLGNGVLRWEPVANLSCSDCPDPIASPGTTTTFTLTVTTAAGCTAVDSVTVHVLQLPVLVASSDTAICPGDSLQLHATGGAAYRWSPATSLSCSDCADPVASPASTTLYYVEGTGANGCVVMDSVLVTVITPGSVDAGPDVNLCIGESIQLHATGASVYRWSPAAGLSCIDCADPVASPMTTTTYTVISTSASGCTARDSVTVAVLPLPVVNAGADHQICEGESVQLRASGGAAYRWSPAAGLSCSDCADPVATPESTTVYVVEGISNDGCVARDSVIITIHSGEVVPVHIPRNLHCLPGTVLTLPVILDDSISVSGIDSLDMLLRYDPRIFRFEHLKNEVDQSNGWRYMVVSDTAGRVHVRMHPSAIDLRKGDTLAVLNFLSWLGDTLAGEFPFGITFAGSRCLSAESSAGLVMLDSICGMSYRLMFISAEKYALKQNVPNPFNPTTRISFSVAFDGLTRLEIFNAVGQCVAVPIDDFIKAGTYTIDWDARDRPSGLYYYRLRSEAWTMTRSMMLVR